MLNCSAILKSTKHEVQQSALLPLLLGAVLGTATVQSAQAMPTGGSVSQGAATISVLDAQTTQIQQSSSAAVINWDSFNISAGHLVRFQQPSSQAAILNRVTGGNISEIHGQLQANGRIFISNPNGIMVGPTAQINVGGLFLTTLGIDDDDFMSGNYHFSASDTSGHINNQGLIQAASGGFVAMAGNSVSNDGVIVADVGTVHLAAGRTVTLDFNGNGLVHFEIGEGVISNEDGAQAAVSNTGEIYANQGQVTLSAKVASEVFTQAVNNSGVIEARRINGLDGNIALKGFGAGVQNSGHLLADGQGGMAGNILLLSDATTEVIAHANLSARNTTDGLGGTISILGEQVALFDDAIVDVSGTSGGGEILVGGDYQGQGAVPTAQFTFIDESVELKADALSLGDGGRIIVWAEQGTFMHGDISAQGGVDGGNGGFVETSGKVFFHITSTPNLTAAHGEGGMWLLDPFNVTIVAEGTSTSNINTSSPFTPTGNDSQLEVHHIVSALSGGATVTITTGTGGAQAGNITLATDLDFDGTGTNTLILDAANDIAINGSISDGAGTDDVLNVTLEADNSITFNASGSITSNGGDVTLTADMDGNAVGNITMDSAATITSGSGKITMTAAGDITVSGLTSTSTSKEAIFLTSNNGAIVDGDGASVEFDAQSGGVKLIADTGMGTAANELDFNTTFILLDNNVSGDIYVINDGNIFLDEVRHDGTGAGDIKLTATNSGTIFILNNDGGITSTTSGTLILVAANAINVVDDITVSGSIDIDATGTFILTTTDAITAGGNGTTFTIDATGITINNTAGGALRQTGTGTMSLTATGSGNVSLQNNAITMGSGLLTITAAGDSINGNSTGTAEISTSGSVTLTGATIGSSSQPIEITGSGSGILTVSSDATAGEDVYIDVLTDNFSSIVLTQNDADSDIEIDLLGGDEIMISGAPTLSTLSSVVLNNNDIAFTYTLSDTQNVQLDNVDLATSALSVTTSDGNITLSSSNGGIVATGAAVISLVAGGSGNIVTNDVITTSGTLSLVSTDGDITFAANVTSDGVTTITADSDFDGTVDFVIASGILDTGDNDLTITADDMDISGGSIDAGSGNITLLPSNQTDMRLGAGDGTGTFALSIAELGNITTSGTLTLGNEKTGTVTVDSWVATSTISGEVIRCEPWKGRSPDGE